MSEPCQHDWAATDLAAHEYRCLDVRCLKCQSRPINELEVARAQAGLAQEVVELLIHRCAACKAGYKRTGSETQNHWKVTKHYMTEEQSRSLEGHHTYFLDGGYVYCNADLQEWLAKWDALK